MTGAAAAILHAAPTPSGAPAAAPVAPRPERSFADVLGDAAPAQHSPAPSAPAKVGSAPPAKLHPIVKADPALAATAAIPTPASAAPASSPSAAKPGTTQAKSAKTDDDAPLIPTEVALATPAPVVLPTAPPVSVPANPPLPAPTAQAAEASTAVSEAADSEAAAAPAPAAETDDQAVDRALPIAALAADATPVTGTTPADQPAANTGSVATTPVLAPGLAATAADPATPATDKSTGGPPQPAAPPPAPVIQVASLLRNAAPDQNQVFTMQLKPDHLGTVEVRLDIDAKGHATASFVADRPETVQLLQQDQHHLVQALKQAGVAADPGALSFALKDGSTGSGGNGKQTGSGRGNFRGFPSGAAAEIETQAATATSGRRLYDLHA
jgi:flagellar hook-length control protein FliK